MSELKHQLMLNREMSWVPCYLKSEADRYIAELQSANQLEIDEWYNKLMHHKYKRCLAMAEYCASELEIAFRDTCIERSVQGCVFFRRWLNIWRDLAEKFKEMAK